MIKVKEVKLRSLAGIGGIQPGDYLVSINSHKIRDIIDFYFYSADEELEFEFRNKKGRSRSFKTENQPKNLGLVFYEDKIRGCGNRCIFCFVDQLPRGLRQPLYFKDEDFRLSFLKGNFITLTNTSYNDIQRIVSQRLSPLYISVHTVDDKLRRKMLGRSQIPGILPLIEELTKGKIELHTQIVLCPKINDGEYLKRSIKTLSSFYPYVKSIAIVPVGLTKFRKNLFPIKPVTKSIALKAVKLADKYQEQFRNKYKSNLIYLADEFFLLAGLDIPPTDYYDEFYQIENGVGLLRKFLDDFKKGEARLPSALESQLNLNLVTGKLASPHVAKVAEKINRIRNLKASLTTVQNHFLGKSVTVSGLLSGGDIIKTLKGRKNLSQTVILPPDCVNYEGKFLDDLRIRDLQKELKCEVVLGSYNIVDTILQVIKQHQTN